MPPRIVCRCFSYKCKDKKYIDKGLEVSGNVITIQTYERHIEKDEEFVRKFSALEQKNGPYSKSQELTGIIPSHRETTPIPINTEDTGAAADVPPTPSKQAQFTHPLIIDDDPSIKELREAIEVLVKLLAAWLHLVWGLSREATSRSLKMLGIVITFAFQLGFRAAQVRFASNDIHPQIPKDARTAIQHLAVEPTLRRTVHCPDCFTFYPDTKNLPDACLHRETPRSKMCCGKLKQIVKRGGVSCSIPRCLFTTQNFHSWLEFFLSQPGVEDLIDRSYTHVPNGTLMKSVWDSPAWRSLGDFTTTPGNLTFSYYIDWFNPNTNKISAKVVSTGGITFTNLNLPDDIQDLVRHTFFAGMTPPPKEPTATSMNHLSNPIFDEFETMFNGVVVRTFRHPEGTFKRVAVLPGIGDLPAIRKAMGYAGPTSDLNMCSMCKLSKSNINRLYPPLGELRTGEEVYAAGQLWRQAKTKTEQKNVFKAHGVRWTSMHRLTYRDPVQHTMLGVMHNWVEGVLQNHFRKKWGVGIETATSKSTATAPMDDPELDFPVFFGLEDNSDDDEEPVNPATDTDDSDSGAETDGDSTIIDSRREDSEAIFTVAQLGMIRACISNAVVPSWLERPPRNLGEASHGKLKANTWLVLWTVFLPLIIPELWNHSKYAALLENFYDVVGCTNIVCRYETSDELADAYTTHYIRYRGSSLQLFPKVKTVPNHHFAMHNGDLLKYWGPLIKLSEFAGERHNGALQKVNTNHHMADIDFTMMRQICRQGRLQALVDKNQYPTILVDRNGNENGNIDDNGGSINLDDDDHRKSKTTSQPSYETPHTLSTLFNQALAILRRGLGTAERSSATIPTPANNESSKKLENLPNETYELILQYLNDSDHTLHLRHFNQFPHPYDSLVLPLKAISLNHVYIHGNLYSPFAFHPGNSSISFSNAFGQLKPAIIQAIWSTDIAASQRTLLIVQQPVPLTAADNEKNLYRNMPLLQAYVGYDQYGDPSVIELGAVKGHVPYYKRPAGTFGIERATVVMIDSLHRGRV